MCISFTRMKLPARDCLDDSLPAPKISSFFSDAIFRTGQLSRSTNIHKSLSQLNYCEHTRIAVFCWQDRNT